MSKNNQIVENIENGQNITELIHRLFNDVSEGNLYILSNYDIIYYNNGINKKWSISQINDDVNDYELVMFNLDLEKIVK